MNGQQNDEQEVRDQGFDHVERFIKATFDRLTVQDKVLIGLFVALNSTSSVTTRFELPENLWEIVRFGNRGPLVGQSEEANWLKGVGDGIRLMVDHI